MKPCVDPITGLRMKPTALAVLNRLRKGRATTHDLCQPEVGGIRFGGRIGELRDLGFIIHKLRLGGGVSGSVYTLIAEPETSQSSGVARRGYASLRSASTKQVPGTPAPDPSSPAVSSAGDIRHGAQGEPATGLLEPDETADMPAPFAPLMARAETSLFDPEPYTQRPGMDWAA